MERFWRATVIVTRVFGAATWLILPGMLEDILPMLVRPHAAKVLTSSADLNLLRWLYPPWRPTPLVFWVRLLELPPPSRFLWDDDDRTEFARRLGGSVEAGLISEAVVERVQTWQGREKGSAG